MNSKWITASAFAVGSILTAATASAQEKDSATPSQSEDALAPARRAVELTIATGYQQGFGKIASNRPTLTDLGTAGGGVEVGVGYRIVPRLTVGGYGSWGMFGRGDQVGDSSHIYTASSGAKADFHFLPAGHQLDPWVSLGTGWRGYWVTGDAGTYATHGLEIAKLQVGLDYRVAQAVAISPVIGGTLTSFFTESGPAQSGFHDVSGEHVSTFVFAGVQGRFDIPTSSGASKVASR